MITKYYARIVNYSMTAFTTDKIAFKPSVHAGFRPVYVRVDIRSGKAGGLWGYSYAHDLRQEHQTHSTDRRSFLHSYRSTGRKVRSMHWYSRLYACCPITVIMLNRINECWLSVSYTRLYKVIHEDQSADRQAGDQSAHSTHIGRQAGPQGKS